MDVSLYCIGVPEHVKYLYQPKHFKHFLFLANNIKMALRLVAMSLKQSAAIAPAGARCFSYTEKIGKREIVGYGCNGLPVYIDRTDYPMPAIRFKEDTPEILVLFRPHFVFNSHR